RTVYVSVGSAGRVPRRYRGRDIFGWLVDIVGNGAEYSVTLPTADQLPDGRRKFSAMPAPSGQAGGSDTTLRAYPARGSPRPRTLTGVDGERLTFADDLAGNLEFADRFFDERLRPTIDAYIKRAGIAAPADARVAIEYEPLAMTE